MIEQAKQLHPGIDFREGDAEQLPLGSGLFDAVAMNFGILHLGLPEKALAEAYRVLRPEGRFAFSVWRDPQETIGFGIVLRAVEAHGCFFDSFGTRHRFSAHFRLVNSAQSFGSISQGVWRGPRLS